MNTDFFLDALGELDDGMLWAAEAPAVRCVTPRRRKVLRVALIAAVLSVFFSVSAYAVSGIPTVRYIEGSLPGRGWGESHYSHLEKLEDRLGFSIYAPESFSNGYVFSEAAVSQNRAKDADGGTLRRYEGLNILYTKAGGGELNLDIEPDLDLPTDFIQRQPDATATVDGVELCYLWDVYKLVPTDYTETPEDQARKAAGHFYLAWGWENVEERQLSSVIFSLDGVYYRLISTEGASAQELFTLAEEILAMRGQ